MKVEWSGINMGILASSGNDRRVIVWDLSKEEKDSDLDKALVIILNQFIHAGHKSKVNDLSWNFNDKLVIASVEQDNIL